MLGKDILSSVSEMLQEIASEPATGTESGNQANNRRSKPRLQDETLLVLRPASSSARHQEKISATCSNYTPNGCGITAKTAPRVGDIYRIEVLQKPQHPLHSAFARCVRCSLIDEDLFEAGMCFLRSIDGQPNTLAITSDNELI